MNNFNVKKVLSSLTLVGVISVGVNYLYSHNYIIKGIDSTKDMSRSGVTVVDISTGETIFSNASNNEDDSLSGKDIGFKGMYRGARTLVDIETGEVISTSRYGY